MAFPSWLVWVPWTIAACLYSFAGRRHAQSAASSLAAHANEISRKASPQLVEVNRTKVQVGNGPRYSGSSGHFADPPIRLVDEEKVSA
jgi:hypothetical protein